MSSNISVNLSELKKALSRLKEAIALPKDDIVRDSVIQRFEFTVELSWKTLSKKLKAEGVTEQLSPKSVIREAARLGYLNNPDAWMIFLDDRSLSILSYREDLAEKVYQSACNLPAFVDDLVTKLER